jgi:hypothetical protein
LNGYLGYTSDLYGIAIGETDAYLKYDPTNGLRIKGNITASTGSIGGFDIGADYIRDATNSFGLASTVTDGNDTRFWAGDTFANRATAPFNLKENGDARVNVLTNKSIFFENTTTPAAEDGQLWSADNVVNQKVLWGYFGGDTTNKQQISMSGMSEFNYYDLDNRAGSSPASYDLVTSTWFQPRTVTVFGVIRNNSATKFATTQGYANNGGSGFVNGMNIELITKTNVVSGLSFTTGDAIEKVAGGQTMTNPLIPATIDGNGHVTGVFNLTAGTKVYAQSSWNAATFSTGASWTNNSFSAVSSLGLYQAHLALSAYDATAQSSVAYAYAYSWSDTGMTIRLTVNAGWAIGIYANIIG